MAQNMICICENVYSVVVSLLVNYLGFLCNMHLIRYINAFVIKNKVNSLQRKFMQALYSGSKQNT